MVIDIIVLIILLLAILRGYKRGIIAALFSFVGLVIIFVAGVPLSVKLAEYFSEHNSKPWLPAVSFLIVVIGIMFLMRWIAILITKALNWTMLGGLNRLAGICLFICIYLTILSILIFYAVGSNMLSANIIQNSYTVNYLKWWGNKSIEMFSAIFPFLKTSFIELKNYFTHNSFFS